MFQNLRIPGHFLILMTMLLLVAAASAQEERVYTVQPGDNLQGIAAFYDSSIEAIAARNGIIDPSRIRPGQQIIIPAPGSNVSATVTTYTIQPGDRLSDIATRYNTTVDELRQINTIINPSRIRVGQVLQIPTTAVGSPIVAPQQPVVVQPQQPVIVQPVRQVFNGFYHVRSGDTLFAIAASFNVDVYELARANGILNLNLIYAGQALRIPGY
jgi:LysM repeat protein